MTHSPPVPPGNTSPFPLEEPVHADPLPRPILAEPADAVEPAISTSAIIAGIAGLGALIATGALYVLRDRRSGRSASSKRRKKAARVA